MYSFESNALGHDDAFINGGVGYPMVVEDNVKEKTIDNLDKRWFMF